MAVEDTVYVLKDGKVRAALANCFFKECET